MASKTDLCNFALSHLGISVYIANVDTDVSKEARVCRKWYNHTLEHITRDYDWNFSRRYLSLALLASTPPEHWTYTYAYPADCFMLRALMPPGVRFPVNTQRVLYEVAGESVGDADLRVIYTDQPNAVARYSKKIVNTNLYDSVFSTAFSYLLASFIAMPLTVKPPIADSMRRAYMSLGQQGYALNNMEAQDGPEPEQLELIRG